MADITAQSPTDIVAKIGASLKRGEIALALGVVAILSVLILPMPPWLLDISLALSITFSVLFLMGGNFVIGAIVFTILVVVNFVVITKGSGRIAEVAARFSLDSMPGKQMAIDADMSAGLIDEATARKRRSQLEDESNFFGAMDGASKFVRGDAVAGLIITFINIVAGIIIGVVQKGLTFSAATQAYTVLTVGDGLVTQIPALIVATAAGMRVSKAGVVGSADKALFGQLSKYPSALGLASVLMAALAVLPGIPMLPFLALAGLTGGAAWRLTAEREKATVAAAQA